MGFVDTGGGREEHRAPHDQGEGGEGEGRTRRVREATQGGGAFSLNSVNQTKKKIEINLGFKYVI